MCDMHFIESCFVPAVKEYIVGGVQGYVVISLDNERLFANPKVSPSLMKTTELDN